MILTSVSGCSMKNVIYKNFIFQIHWVICVIPMLFEKLYKIPGLAGVFITFKDSFSE